MKTLLSKPYFVIPLTLAGILVNGALLIGGLSLLAKVFAPEPPAEVVEPEQAPAQVAIKVEPPEATTTPEPPMVTLQDALPVGYKAATLAQTAKTKEEWNAVAKQWLAAIEILEEVPETSPDYSTAKAKRNEYLKNIEIANAKAQAASGDSAQPLPLTTAPDSSSSPVSTANGSRPKGTCLLREGYVIAINRELFDQAVGYAARNDEVAFQKLNGVGITKDGIPVYVESAKIFSGTTSIRLPGETSVFYTNTEAVDCSEMKF